jgi:geranylgeranyl diphosphate synthase, type II
VNLLSIAQERIDPALETALGRIDQSIPSDGRKSGHKVPPRLHQAMRYALLAPGKRLRPALVIGAATAVGGDPDDVIGAACAVEMIHAYSLVHDDLPALDDDDVRRGQPSCHRAFDEATALLAGDALLIEAVSLIADGRPIGGGRRVRARRRLQAVLELSRAVGAAGMAGGQYDDIEIARALGADLERRTLLSIHRRKTARLIQASVAIGAIMGGGSSREVRILRRFGGDIGLAFQIVDDAIDGDGIAKLEGNARALQDAARLTRRGIRRLSSIGKSTGPLIALARALVEREG